MIIEPEVAHLSPPVTERDHVRGPDTASVTLVEYGDYECPYCRMAHGIVQQVEEVLGDRLRFVFRHFPLTQAHPHAELAAEAAEAAGAQGRFWEMHDTLYQNQEHLEAPALVRYAAAIGLDLPRFEGDLVERAFAPRVREHFLSGVHSGVNGTPTFFINGIRHDGPWDAPSLLAALREAGA